MALTFKSSTPESFTLIGRDVDGSKRVAVATKADGHNRWDLRLEHPSGTVYTGSFNGVNILDGLSEMVRSKDGEYRQERNRGHKPEPRPFDYNRPVAQTGEYEPNFATTIRHNIPRR